MVAMAASVPTPSHERPVLAAFPEHRERLLALAELHADLGELCDDYDTVVAAYDRATSGQITVAGAADEYHRLKLELEVEILDWIGRRR